MRNVEILPDGVKFTERDGKHYRVRLIVEEVSET